MKPAISRSTKFACLCMLLASTMLTGCIFSVTGRPSCPRPYHGANQGRHTEDATILEIRTVSELSFESSRCAAFKAIAARPDLSTDAQQCLIKTAMDSLSFESSREAVLLALIDNPAFGLPAKRAILRRIDALSFEATKTRVMEAMSDRPAPPVDAPQAVPSEDSNAD